MKKINIYIGGFLLLGLVSCKDFLDEKPSNSTDSKTSIQTPADAKVMINGLMRNMTSSSYYGRNFIMYGDAKGGDLTVFMQGRGLDPLYTFAHDATTNNYGGFWSQIYVCILQTNNLLENIARIESQAPNAEFNTYKGQALTARALMYFDLVRIYGKSYNDSKSSYGVPNITTTLPASAQPLRASVEDNYKQILDDLKAAAPLLPKTKTNGFLNYYANLAIQARVYLNMGDNVNALKAAQEIISATAVYTLYSNANWVNSWRGQFGTESIFELGVFPNEGDLLKSALGLYLRRAKDGSPDALGFFMASTPFLAKLGQDAADVRWGMMSYDETSNTRMGACYKYSGSPIDLKGDGKATATAVNIKVIRLSEVYLIAAEAALPTDKNLAVGYLNAIRKRSPNLAPADISNITTDMILEERSKELFGEGQRFFDMMRLNKTIAFDDAFGGLTVTKRPGSITRAFDKAILPIPQDEINANPGLAAQQNSGY